MQVFISHASKDAEPALQLAEQLARAGFSVWSAAEEIGSGDNWGTKIGQALESCDLMVALFTPGAIESDTLRWDVQYALTSKKFEHRLVPVLVGFETFAAGKDVPWILLTMEPVYVDSSSNDFNGVVDRVKAIAEREANAAR